MKKRALITGITGQDGSYLAEHLLDLGYEVHGLVRRVALEQPEQRLGRLKDCLDRIHIHPASLDSYASVFHVFTKQQFDECYHLAAQSFVAESFADGFSTMSTNINGTHYVLAALAKCSRSAVSTSPDRARCSARCARRRSAKRRPFIPAAPTASVRSPASTSR